MVISVESEIYTEKIEFIELLGRILLRPRETFSLLINKPSRFLMYDVFLVYLFFTSVKISTLIVVLETINGSIFPGFPSGLSFISLTLILSLVAVASLFVSSFLSHFVAKEIFKGVGNMNELLNLYGYSSISNVVVVALSLIAIFLPTPINIGLIVVSYIIYLLWKAILYMISVEEVYGLDEFKAFISGVIVPSFLLVFLF